MKFEQRKHNKIILTGPPGAGKTTIEKVYFEMANPLKLLNYSLDPTRGVISCDFTYFNKEFTIFDLAGQENDNWFSDERGIFNGSNIIICIFDIRNSIEFIIQFLIKVLNLQKVLKLKRCKTIVLLHKIDLVGLSYVNLKVEKIRSFYKLSYANGHEFRIYRTSISNDFFFQTYNIVLDIINFILKIETILSNKKKIKLLEKDLFVLLNSKMTLYDEEQLSKELNIKESTLKIQLSRLEQIGFIVTSLDSTKFQLTDRACFFKIGLEKEMQSDYSPNYNKAIESINNILNLNKLKVKI